jgi:hypothetical protein
MVWWSAFHIETTGAQNRTAGAPVPTESQFFLTPCIHAVLRPRAPLQALLNHNEPKALCHSNFHVTFVSEISRHWRCTASCMSSISQIQACALT